MPALEERLEAPVVEGVAALPAPFRVAAARQETADTVSLRLEPASDGAAGFAPGQFAMLYAFGVGEVPISISDVLDGDGRVMTTVRAVGAVTRAICAASPGDVLGLRGPFGNTWPLAQAQGHDVVVMAGGLGLAPLRPVVVELLARRERYGTVSVLYGGRAPGELLFSEELERWRGRFDVDVHVTVDVPSAGWHGRVGLVTELVRGAAFDPARTLAMVCGPEVMMRFAVRTLEAHGLRDDAIWLSLERSMKCGMGHCGHCQLGPLFVCRDGPVFRLDEVDALMRVAEL